MSLQILISQAGPLPIQISFQSPGDAPMVLEVSGSVWSEYEDLTVGVGVELDGVVVGAAQIHVDVKNVHYAVVPAYIPVKLSQGSHTLRLYLVNGETSTNKNDFYNAVLHI